MRLAATRQIVPHPRFRTRGAKRPIAELLPMKQGLPDPHAPTVHNPADLLKACVDYYSTLMDKRDIDEEAAEEVFELFRKRPLPKGVAAKEDPSISESEVMTAISKLARGKSPGPDSLPSEFYHAYGSHSSAACGGWTAKEGANEG